MKIVIATILAISITSFCHPQNNHDIIDYDILNYSISISTGFQNKTFDGSVELTIYPLKQINKLVLHAASRTIFIDSIKLENQNVMSFEHSDELLNVNLFKYYSDTISLTIFYKTTADYSGDFDDGGIFFSSETNNIKIATNNQPFFARKWLPCKDIPSDKATVSMKVKVPAPYFAISNGSLDDVMSAPDGSITYFWKTKYPTAAYLISFAIGKYELIHEKYIDQNGKELAIQYYVFPEYLGNAKLDFSNTQKMLRFLTEYFGEYPFIDEKYGIAIVDGNITMENQTVSFIQQDYILGDGTAEIFLIHELAHQWFGNKITPSTWHHTWLSEGFATYAQALYYEYYLGKDYYHKIMNHYMSVPFGSYAGSVIGQTDTSFWDSFSDRVYFKGAIVLHMLRKLSGDSLFFQILRNYSANPKYSYSNVTTEDFIFECEKLLGKNISLFFDQWVYAFTDSIDRPVISYAWESSLTDGKWKITLSLKQLTSNILTYTLPIDISVETREKNYTFDIILKNSEDRFELILDEEPLKIEIDKYNWLFKFLVPL